jgi:hypothetical protein
MKIARRMHANAVGTGTAGILYQCMRGALQFAALLMLGPADAQPDGADAARRVTKDAVLDFQIGRPSNTTASW